MCVEFDAESSKIFLCRLSEKEYQQIDYASENHIFSMGQKLLGISSPIALTVLSALSIKFQKRSIWFLDKASEKCRHCNTTKLM